MKIFEIRDWYDGGPNDRGYLEGYIKCDSEEKGKKILGINDGFTSLIEITEEEFLKRKHKLEEQLKMYENIL